MGELDAINDEIYEVANKRSTALFLSTKWTQVILWKGEIGSSEDCTGRRLATRCNAC